MTDSALDRARREANRAASNAIGHEHEYGVCDEPGSKTAWNACPVTKAAYDTIARLEAAARLAGRLEQAERSVELHGDYDAYCEGAGMVLREERDRLRREAGK